MSEQTNEKTLEKMIWKVNWAGEDEDMIYKDKDEVTKYLIPYEEISEFWELNKDFVENYKKLIHGWALHFCQIIKGKYAESDPDLKPRKRMKKPPNKTMGK